MRKLELLASTDSSRMYKLIRFQKICFDEDLCLFCWDHYGLRGGENHIKRTPHRSWKRTRKTQYKIRWM